MWKFIVDHWVLITLVVSEGLPFLPTKASGIVQGLINILGDIILKVKK